MSEALDTAVMQATGVSVWLQWSANAEQSSKTDVQAEPTTFSGKADTAG